MSNPLIDLRNLVSTGKSKTYIGTVESSSNGKAAVKLVGGNTVEVWGTASAGDEVLLSNGSIIAVVSKEDVPTVYIT